MNKMIIWCFCFLSLSSGSVALAAPSASAAVGPALELLNLPSENRRVVLNSQGDKHYASFVAVAFDSRQTMSLRWRALMAAAEARGEGSTSDLLKAGESKDWFMRNAALVSLAEVNPEAGEKLAKKLLKDKALVVRSAAVQVLEKSASVGGGEVRDLLWEELNQTYNFQKQQSLWIRHQIVSALAQKPAAHEMKLFAGLLADKDARVQTPAVRGLEKLTGKVLGENKQASGDVVSLWRDYVKKEKLEM